MKPDYEKIIKSYYLEILNREADEPGLKHYLNLFSTGKITIGELEKILKNSQEYTIKHLPKKLESLSSKERLTEIAKLLKTSESQIEKIVLMITNCYDELLNRAPDSVALVQYTDMILNKIINKKKLHVIIIDSFEYKLSHPIQLNENDSIDIKMKKEWDARTKLDPLFVITTGYSKDEPTFWNSGIVDCENILETGKERFSEITKNKKASEMKILEIGCGIGRILIPMSKIFRETVGIDISTEMVQLAQKYVGNIPNCDILESNGVDLSLFTDNHFDFCYSFIVFQHIPEKKIVEKYIEEVSRVLKPDCLFRFQVRGIVDTKPKELTTWNGVQFSSKEIHEIAKKNSFEIIEEGNDKEEYYMLTFKSVK